MGRNLDPLTRGEVFSTGGRWQAARSIERPEPPFGVPSSASRLCPRELRAYGPGRAGHLARAAAWAAAATAYRVRSARALIYTGRPSSSTEEARVPKQLRGSKPDGVNDRCAAGLSRSVSGRLKQLLRAQGQRPSARGTDPCNRHIHGSSPGQLTDCQGCCSGPCTPPPLRLPPGCNNL